MLKQTLKYKQAVIVKKRSLEASRPAVRSEADLGPVVRGYACRGILKNLPQGAAPYRPRSSVKMPVLIEILKEVHLS